MATLAEAFTAAALGVAGGLIGAAAMERLKAGMASLDAELVRLENFEDDLFDAYDCPLGDQERPTIFRHLAGRRRRLGQNIKWKVLDSAAYEACKTQLAKLDTYLEKAEDGSILTSELEAEIQSSIAALRGHLRRSSKTAKAFALLRGDT